MVIGTTASIRMILVIRQLLSVIKLCIHRIWFINHNKNVGVGHKVGYYNVTGTGNGWLGYQAGQGVVVTQILTMLE